MSGLFGGGGGGGQNTVDPVIGSLNVQTSTFGMAIPIVYGQTRITANLIWYGDFTAIPHTTTQASGGKGGGGASSSNTTFTYTAAVAMGLCEGTVVSIGNVWAGKELTSLTSLGLTLFTGATNQTAWGFLTTNHATQAINYSGLAYVATPAYDLGGSANLPNHSFEVKGILNYSPAGGINGAKPDLLLNDYLTNTQYGVGIPAAKIGSLTQYNAYCMAAGILLSPAYTAQAAANTHIDEMMLATNSGVVWSEGVMKIIPYGDTAITGSWGVNYTPNNSVLYDLNDDDFIAIDADPVIVTRKNQADSFNQVQVEFIDSANQYNVAIATASDIANIDLFGLRPQQPVTLHCITTLSQAQIVAQALLQRALYIRNTYTFTVGMRYSLLEPMDIVTITDAALGLNLYPVRIIEIIESVDGEFTITAEDFLAGVSHASTYPSQTGAGYQADYNISSGNANAPVIFEPPTSLSVDPQIWLATSGGANWGGCEVWVSRDNTTYTQVGTINGKARHGVLSAALATGGDPDTTNTLAVNLSTSSGSLLGGTLADRDQMNTLCYVDGELISYQNAALTSLYNYNLTSLRRGAYGSARAAHTSGTKFARLDQAIFKYNYDPAMIGSTIYIKLRSFNIYGLARQDLAGLTPISYAVAGSYMGAISGLALAQPFVGNSVKVKWNAYTGASSYKVEIWVGASLKRTVTGITSTVYEYTYEDMLADGGAWRSVDIKVYAVSANSSTLSAATLTVSNPQMGAPLGISAVAGALSATVSITKPTASDFAGMMIFGSSTSGFTPDTTTFTNMLYDGFDVSKTFTGLTGGVPMYYRVAIYDAFGKDSLTLSSEVAATPFFAGGISIVSSLPAVAGAVDGNVVSYTVDHKLYRFNSTANAWQTWVDGTDILASSVTAGKMSVTSIGAINANLGVITAGNITLNAGSWIQGGQTAYNTGSGFFMGYSGTTYKVSFGNSGASQFLYDGSTVSIRSGTTGARLELVNDVIRVYDAAGVLRVKIGNLA